MVVGTLKKSLDRLRKKKYYIPVILYTCQTLAVAVRSSSFTVSSDEVPGRCACYE